MNFFEAKSYDRAFCGPILEAQSYSNLLLTLADNYIETKIVEDAPISAKS